MEIDIDYKALNQFWGWITERENVRVRRQYGHPRPWSSDVIFQTQHFCNVRREDDRITKEIHAVIRSHGVVPVEDMPYWYTIARMFNKPETLDRAMTAWFNGAHWPTHLKRVRAEGHKLFHVAYVVSTCGKSMDKVDYVGRVTLDVARLDVPRVGLQKAFNELVMVDGLGSFMAGQIVADLRNSGYLVPEDKAEAKFWCVSGPGSIKGLKYIFRNFSARHFTSYIDELYLQMPEEIKRMDLHAQDLQNCLCEFSKYMRIYNDEGGRRRQFRGEL